MKGKWFLVLDGQRGTEYDVIGAGSVAFSPDGTRIAYAAFSGDISRRRGKWSIVVDGQARAEYDGLWGLSFSPDSKRIAYAAGKNDRWFVVVDDQPGPEYESVQSGPVFLAAGGLEYLAIKKDETGQRILYRVTAH
jgi:hypothetical protein